MPSVPSLSEFVIKHNILTTVAAVTIAFSSGTMIRSLVSDIILPCLYSLFVRNVNELNTAFKPLSSINVDNFLREFVSWVLVLLVTYFLIEYACHFKITPSKIF